MIRLILFILILTPLSAHAEDKTKSKLGKPLSQDCEPYKSFWDHREMDPTFDIPKKCVEEFTALEAITPKKKSRVGEYVRL